MLRKILIALGIIALILILGFVYLNHRNRTLSPPGKVVFEKNNLYLEVNHSRPSVRERLIFGAAADGALQPYGSYWRLGANEATEITINQDVTFNGVPEGRNIPFVCCSGSINIQNRRKHGIG